MSNTKKVVHLTTVHHPLDPRIYYKQCLSLQKAGFDVTLIATDAEKIIPERKINLISLTKYRNRFLRMIVSTYKAYKLAKNLKADFYHIHDPELLPFAWMLKRSNNIVIYDIHEDYETSMMQKEYLPKPLRMLAAKMFKTVESFFTRKLELCLAEKYYIEKYPRGKCILNYPVLNETLINKPLETKPAEEKLLYTGNVSVERGAFIHAKLPLIDEQISVHFVGKCPKSFAEKMYEIAGENKERLYIEGIDQFIDKQVIDQHYINTNWLAGIALFPPTDHYKKKELTKFFEYMSAGIPIICSDFPAWKEFMEKYECGIAVDPSNEEEIRQAISFLRENVSAAQEMGQNGKRAVIDKLNWKVEEEKLVDWYRELSKRDG
ncbi:MULTISPECIES: glycosyltransferase [Bacillaceae]|uniref:Glycosyltransferase n=1 Tax=Evansella alkalicola TaxID=745819 RepID=A0ABS6JWU6_9BACI|nr:MULTISPECIES: glycosyltransferase [Bacillaceae]MBU9722707.1 glycosyltransferase [Bacillus alkalicola]